MHNKRSFLLLALFVAVVIALFLADQSGKTATNDTPPTDLSAEEVASAAQDVTALTYGTGALTLRFTRTDSGSWSWADVAAFPLDGSYPDRIAATVKALPVLATIPLTEEAPLSTYGLDGQTVYMTYRTAEGEITLVLGNQDESGNYYFTRSDDADNVYLTDGTLREQMSTPIESMMVMPTLPALTGTNIRAITVANSGGATVELTNTAQDGASPVWTAGGLDVTGRDEVTALLAELTAYSMDACFDYAPSDSAYSLCGMSEPIAQITVRYVNTVGVEAEFSIYIGMQRGDNYCAMLSNDATIYLIGSGKITQLLTLAAGGLSA